MSDSSPALRLPARPSLEHLRKHAKSRLDTLRASDPEATLAVAQYAVARDYGFESWPKLVHHVEGVASAQRLDRFDRLAADTLAGFHGDEDALRRLITHYGVLYSPEQARIRVQSQVNDARGTTTGDPSLADVQAMLAHEYGFDSWAAFAEGLAQPPDDTRGSRLGISAAPPFYKIDSERNAIEVRAPVTDGDWDTIFAVMEERRITGIRTPAMTDSAMARLSRLDFVTSAHIGGPGLTDEGLLQCARMPQLEELEPGGNVTDRGFAVLRHLPRLRRFAICWLNSVTDAGMAHLADCSELESVNLMGTHTGDGALAALRGKPRLSNLNTGRQVTDAGVAMLHDFPFFKTWQGGEFKVDLMTFGPEGNNILLDGPFTDRGLASLAGLAGVFGLGFFWHAHQFTGAGLAALSDLPNLGFLGCQGERCDDAAMRSIASIPKLRMLMAQGTVATDDGFTALSRSSSIEYLWGRECANLHGRGFAAMAEMPRLRGLGVSCLNVDDASLASLPHFPSLRQLMPMDVNDAGFRHVGACAALEDLWCMYCRDTGDSATEHISALKLETYYAGKTLITDRSLEILGRMTSLESIELWQTAGVTDAGLASLIALPRLKKFSISGAPRVTRQGVTVFPASVRVDYGS